MSDIPERLRFAARDESDTDRLGEALARTLPDGTTVALIGTLGSGKTRLVQAIAMACGVPGGEVTSPTFVLCQQYRARRLLFHFDAYRLRDEDEFLQLGPEECFEADALTLIEWADRVIDCLPPERVEIRIEIVDGDAREFDIAGIGRRFNSVIDALKSLLGGSCDGANEL